MMSTVSPTDTIRDWAFLTGRVLLVALFALSGLQKFGQIDGISAALGSKGIPLPALAAWGGALLEVVGAVGVLVGYRTRIAAAGLIVFTVLATVLFHNYWDFAPEAREGEFIHFLKNVGLVGGFLLLIGAGPGRFSVDGRNTTGRRAP